MVALGIVDVGIIDSDVFQDMIDAKQVCACVYVFVHVPVLVCMWIVALGIVDAGITDIDAFRDVIDAKQACIFMFMYMYVCI